MRNHIGAIHDHSQNTVEPTTAQLDAIAEFQRTNGHFFSSDELKEFAAGDHQLEQEARQKSTPPPGIHPWDTRAAVLTGC
jgi:hypothetical protein